VAPVPAPVKTTMGWLKSSRVIKMAATDSTCFRLQYPKSYNISLSIWDISIA